MMTVRRAVYVMCVWFVENEAAVCSQSFVNIFLFTSATAVPLVLDVFVFYHRQ